MVSMPNARRKGTVAHSVTCEKQNRVADAFQFAGVFAVCEPAATREINAQIHKCIIMKMSNDMSSVWGGTNRAYQAQDL
jgi:hypothetical protein